VTTTEIEPGRARLGIASDVNAISSSTGVSRGASGPLTIDAGTGAMNRAAPTLHKRFAVSPLSRCRRCSGGPVFGMPPWPGRSSSSTTLKQSHRFVEQPYVSENTE